MRAGLAGPHARLITKWHGHWCLCQVPPAFVPVSVSNALHETRLPKRATGADLPASPALRVPALKRRPDAKIQPGKGVPGFQVRSR